MRKGEEEDEHTRKGKIVFMESEEQLDKELKRRKASVKRPPVFSRQQYLLRMHSRIVAEGNQPSIKHLPFDAP